MTIHLHRRSFGFLFLGATLLIILTGLFTVQSDEFYRHPDLFSFAITIDITVLIPLLYYFFVSRKLRVKPITTLIVFLFCTIIAGLILPGQHHDFLNKVQYLLILTECALAVYGIINLRKIWKSYKIHSYQQPDFLLNITHAFEEVYGKSKLVGFFAGEAAIVRYGIFGWKGRKEILPDQKFFTTYIHSGYASLWWIICFIMLTEMIWVHLLLQRWNETVAIVITLLSLYTFVMLIADYVGLIKRPVLMLEKKLLLRTGIRWNAEIAFENIESAVLIKTYNADKNPGTLNASSDGYPNILIRMKKPVNVKGFYGTSRTVYAVVFRLDEPGTFIHAITAKVS